KYDARIGIALHPPPSPDLVLIKQAKQVQVLALPSVCGACWRKRIACLRISNREKKHRIWTHKLRGGSRC
ncbi:MAG: hypothetical protein WBX30_26710, partial [Stellaceae bacterium]